MGASDDSRSDRARHPTPGLRVSPPVRGNEVVKHFSNRFGRGVQLFGPFEVLAILFSNSDEYDPWTQLRNAEIRGVHELPSRLVPEFQKLRSDVMAVARERRVQDAPHVLNHYGPRPNLVHQPDHRREQVSLVFRAKLLSGNRERRAWQATRNDVYTLK